MSIRGPVSRLLDPERSRFSSATITLLSVSAWINNTLAFLFWVGLELNNLGVWGEANGFWFVVLLLLAPIFITLLGLFWQILAIPLVLLVVAVYWLWAETISRFRRVLRPNDIEALAATPLERVSSSSTPTRPMAGNVKGVAEGLRELAKLREEGILTQEEYEAKRRQLAEEL